MPRLLYAGPMINSVRPLVPANGPTNGGYLVTMRGANFGPKQRNTSIPALAVDVQGTRFANPLPLAEAAGMPTEYLRLDFYRSCLTDARNPEGVKPQQGRTASCQYSLVDRDHDFVTFRVPEGIGASRDVAVEIVDAAVAMGIAESGAYGFSGSQSAISPGAFSYDAPTVDRTDPARVYMAADGDLEDYRRALDAGRSLMLQLGVTEEEARVGNVNSAVLIQAQSPVREFINSGGVGFGNELLAIAASTDEAIVGPSKRVFLFGRNYGNPAMAVAQNWSQAEIDVAVSVGGIDCMSS